MEDIEEVEVIGGQGQAEGQQPTAEGQGPSQVLPPNPSVNPPIAVKKRSPIYDYFDYIESRKKWKCKHCLTHLQKAKDKGTGSLGNHLSAKHPARYREYLLKKQAQGHGLLGHITISKPAPALAANPDDQIAEVQFDPEEFKSLLIEFIVSSDQPFSLVEEEGFQKVMSCASKNDPELVLPNRKLVRQLIQEKYQAEKKKLKKTLETNSSKVSFSIDCWTSSNQHPFQGVTAHWIDDDWKLRTALIDMTLLDGCHSGENLAASFSEVLTDYNLWGKLLSLTTDNAGNMKTLFDFLEVEANEKGVAFNTKNYRVRCMAHILNLACQAALQELDKDYSTMNEDDVELENNFAGSEQYSTLKKLRTSIKGIRWSHTKKEIFRQQCGVVKLDFKNLKLDVKTRWNSTLDMLERALEFRVPLELTLQMNKNSKKLILTDEEWSKIEQLIELLVPFREATLLMSSASVPTLADTVAIYNALFVHLEKYLDVGIVLTSHRQRTPDLGDNTHPEWLKQAANCSWTKLVEYYPSIDGLVFSVSTVLDPRFKTQWYAAAGWNSTWINDARREVRKCWSKYYKPTPNTTSEQEALTDQQAPKKFKLSSIQSSINQQLVSAQSPSQQDELTRYLAEAIVPENSLVLSEDGKSGVDGVLGWWKMRQVDFPNLSKMARDFLAVSGTGVPVERAFSSATDLLSQRRQSLKAETIRECVCLKYWLKKRSSSSILSAIQSKAFNEL